MKDPFKKSIFWLIEMFLHFYYAEDKISFEAQKDIYMRWKGEAEKLQKILEEKEVLYIFLNTHIFFKRDFAIENYF